MAGQPLQQPVEQVTKAMLKAGPQFQIQYGNPENTSSTTQRFYTREANDQYAEAMELMGARWVVKAYFDPLTRKWLPYTDRIFYTESI